MVRCCRLHNNGRVGIRRSPWPRSPIGRCPQHSWHSCNWSGSARTGRRRRLGKHRWRHPRTQLDTLLVGKQDNLRMTLCRSRSETFLQGTTSNERLHRYLPAMPRQNGPQHMTHSFLRDSPRLGGNCCKTRETHRRTRAERATNSHHRTQGHCTTCRWQHRPRLGTCRLKRCITRTLTPKLPAVPCQRHIPCTQLQPLRCTCPADTGNPCTCLGQPRPSTRRAGT